MDDWLEHDDVIEFFKWKSTDTVTTNLDEYICKNISTYGPEYIFKLLKDWEDFVMDDTSKCDHYETVYKYYSTYIKLYVVSDTWCEFYTKFLPLLRDL